METAAKVFSLKWRIGGWLEDEEWNGWEIYTGDVVMEF